MPAIMAGIGALAADVGMVSMIILMARVALFAHHFLKKSL